MYPVVDFHIHVMPGERIHKPVQGWMQSFVPEPLLRLPGSWAYLSIVHDLRPHFN